METLARAWTRVITWRIITTILGFAVLYIMTGQWVLTVGFTAINALVQTVFHIVHERMWDKIQWGKK